ncbi:MAG: DUF1727 domain-containing protein [Clostridia bacterium]|nr:DUF1727 domain-containing protein [Clostridia bacterium]
MKRLQLIVSIWLCKILILLGKILGKRSSSAPGRFALKICPDAVKLLAPKVQYEIICVLGTNGKTTTNNMINTMLLDSGYQTVCNSVGANMFDGAATAFLSKAGIFGSLKADYAVLEIDEATAKIVFDHLTPDIIVVTNLFRDQMDRYGEIDQTLKQLELAIQKAPDALLCLNADDPMSSYFTKAVANKTVTFGVSEEVKQPLLEEKEGRACQFCGEKLEYQFYHYNQLGSYRCPNCDFKRPDPDFYATNVVCEPALKFRFNEKEDVSANIFGFYNLYNMLAAMAIAELLELKQKSYTELFSRYQPQTARMEVFPLQKPVILNLAKNPAGFNQAIATLLNDPRKKAVVVGINDMPSDGCDISWLYDVNFEELTNCSAYGAAGRRCYDVALRLYYAEVCETPETEADPVSLALKFLETDCEVVYVLVNYTLIFDAKDQLVKTLKAYQKALKKGDKKCN